MRQKFVLMLILVIILEGCTITKNQQENQIPDDSNIVGKECNINNPDPDGYLLKICQYLVANKNTVQPNKLPNEYNIKLIEFGKYPFEAGKNYDDAELIKIHLDCCGGAGDIAYIDKSTGEVIYFSVGDLPPATKSKLCNQKVKFSGMGEAFYTGYEFDFSLNACVARSGSGDSIKTPFKTMSECKKICE